MNNLLDYVKEYPNAFTDTFCDMAINLFEQNAASHQHHDTPGYKFTQLDVNQVDPGLAMYFATAVNEYAKTYFDRLGLSQFIPEYGFEDVRIKKYMPGEDDRFDTHVDVLSHNDARRFLIFILYLDDNETGGTDFPPLNHSIRCEKDKLIAVPPTWQYPHTGLMPSGSPKYIMMTGLHYL